MGRIGLAFLAGHCCIHVLPVLPDTSYIAVLLLGLALAALLRSTVAIVFVVGLAWAWGHAAVRLDRELLPQLEGRDVLVQGRISSLPERIGHDVRFTLDIHASESKLPSRVLLTWYRAPQMPNVGEAWQLVLRLKRRNGFANPAGFDYEAHLFAAGIGATGYIKSDARNVRTAAASGYCVARVRAWLAARMQVASGDNGVLGILQGLAIGDTRQMTSEQWEVFAATGTTHLMAISGLHIAMVAALAAWLGGGIARLPRAQAAGWSATEGHVLAGFAAALAYSLLAGLSLPTQRTLVMLALYFLARWMRRELRIRQALGLALIGLLLVDPFAPLSAGAWLSFGAVAVIVVTMSGRLVRETKVIQFARVQWAVTIGLLPVLVMSFGSFSLVSPFANALAVPVFTLLVVPFVLIGTAGAALAPAVGAPALQMATWILETLWGPLRWLADQPLALWHFSTPSALTSLALLIGVFLVVAPGFWPTKMLGTLFLLTPMAAVPKAPAIGQYQVSVLDVGQGLSVVVRTRSRVLVFDAGPAFQSGRDAADFAILPYLYGKGIRKLDLLIVSHSDLDHRGGMSSLIKALRPADLLVGPSLLPTGAEASVCVAGQRWIWDEVKFEIIHPASTFEGSDNDTSCVLRVRGQGSTVLLTGDIEAAAEQSLLATALDRADIVVAPHHGSRTSSTDAFVSVLSPQIVLFSAGYRNRWGLPKPDVVERWRRSGARVLSTDRSGAIEIDVGGPGMKVREHRKVGRRYWSRASHALCENSGCRLDE